MLRIGGENMKILDLEYAIIDIDLIGMIYEPIGAPVKAYVKNLREAVNDAGVSDKFLNLTFGSAANAYIELKDRRIISTSFPLKALYERIREV